ncbi:phosphatidylglycerol lysyltransferase domain-containing protein [Albirhodobacter sp. R86504]|uniref:phosphatidylglycerol lysyltransferase domain-containing protein n=1 Tax=Albirhodobacter sp. R86504 TaxID=3093848 RepID=UPI00366A9EE7
MRHERITRIDRPLGAGARIRRGPHGHPLGDAAPNPTPVSKRRLIPTKNADQNVIRRALLRQALPLIAVIAVGVLLRARIAALDVAAIWAAVGSINAQQWALACAATLISYWSLGRYDAVIHRLTDTPIAPRTAARTGIAAIAISQTVGLGLVSGALVRWHLNTGLSFAQCLKITAVVATSFLLGWFVILGIVLIALPPETSDGLIFAGTPAARQMLGWAGIALGAAVVIAPQFTPAIPLLKSRLRMPPTHVTLRIIFLAGVDTLAAAFALWALVPDGLGPQFVVLLPAFLLALGAGFLAGTPCGIGPFEITLLAMLPAHHETHLLAAVVAWRGVYFAAPACLAALYIIYHSATRANGASPEGAGHREAQAALLNGQIPERPSEAAPLAHSASSYLLPAASTLSPQLEALLEHSQRAETGLLRQGEHGVLTTGNTRAGWIVARTNACIVGLLDPFGTPQRGLASALLPRLHALAKRNARTACLYKISPRVAVQARRAGWAIVPVATEAWIAPLAYKCETPNRAALRRKLRKAEKSGVRTLCAEGPLPLIEMQRISEEWVSAHRGERGFSMGRFAAQYVSAQRVYLAYQGDTLIAFATFHTGAREWALDLMRAAPQAPDGTMHSLLHAALQDARAFKIRRLTLAALPPEAATLRGIAAQVWRHLNAVKGIAGLRQFKSSFAPNWQTLYLAAPSPLHIAVASISIAHAIHRPPPLPQASRENLGTRSEPTDARLPHARLPAKRPPPKPS